MSIRHCKKCGQENIYTGRKVCQVCEYEGADLSHLETCVVCEQLGVDVPQIKTFTLGRVCEHCKVVKYIPKWYEKAEKYDNGDPPRATISPETGVPILDSSRSTIHDKMKKAFSSRNPEYVR